jgi:hypothetical protein
MADDKFTHDSNGAVAPDLAGSAGSSTQDDLNQRNNVQSTASDYVDMSFQVYNQDQVP